MKQYDAVKIVCDKIIDSEYVEAIFLDGSLAKRAEDIYSDVDLYCITNKKKTSIFKSSLFDFMEAYATVLYFKEDGDTVKFIYEDGVIFKVTIVTEEIDLLPADYCPIYDPKKILAEKFVGSEDYSQKDVGELINDFSCKVLEFKANYNRKDIPMAMNVAMKMIETIGVFLRTFDDYANVGMGLKRCYEHLSQENRLVYANMIKEFRYNNLLSFVQMMIMFVTERIKILPLEIGQYVNFDLFDLAKKTFFYE